MGVRIGKWFPKFQQTEAIVTASTVTAGQLVFYGVSGRGLTLKSKELIATLGLADTGSFSIPSGPLKPGDIVPVSGILAGEQTLRNGPANYLGTSHAKLWYEGTLQFEVRAVTAPASSNKPVTIHPRFTFTGNLKAFAASNITGGGGPPVFDVALTGRGRATIVLGASYDVGGGVLARDIRAWFYDFRD